MACIADANLRAAATALTADLKRWLVRLRPLELSQAVMRARRAGDGGTPRPRVTPSPRSEPIEELRGSGGAGPVPYEKVKEAEGVEDCGVAAARLGGSGVEGAPSIVIPSRPRKAGEGERAPMKLRPLLLLLLPLPLLVSLAVLRTVAALEGVVA